LIFSVDQPRFSAASRRTNWSTELVSSRVTALINSGYLGADAKVGRDGHRISTRSLISQTLSETWAAQRSGRANLKDDPSMINICHTSQELTGVNSALSRGAKVLVNACFQR
jgi:hypothetical protein